jgi:hypothetical protein
MVMELSPKNKMFVKHQRSPSCNIEKTILLIIELITNDQNHPLCTLLINLFKLKIDKIKHLITSKSKGVIYFFYMYQGIKFNVHRAKGSQDIEWSVYS